MLVLDQWYLFLDLQTVTLSLHEWFLPKIWYLLQKSHKEKNLIEKCREQSADNLVRPPLLTVSWHFGQTPPLFTTKNSVEKCFSHQFFLTRITFRDIFQWDFFLRVIFAINIIFLVKIIHLMTKWQFVGLKRGITGLKQAWYASTIKFLDCQLTLGPDPPADTMMTLWLRPPLWASADIWMTPKRVSALEYNAFSTFF